MSKWFEKDKLIDITYNGSRAFVCVEHPGLVKNPDKALTTLGGMKNIDKVLFLFSRGSQLCCSSLD